MKRYAAMAVATTLGVLWLATPAAADIDRKALARTWAVAERLLKDVQGDTEAQAEEVANLNGLLDYKTAVELLGYWESCDSAWEAAQDKKAKKKDVRDKTAWRVSSAILAAVRSMNEPEEVNKFEKDLTDEKKWPLRVRMAMLDAVAANAEDEANFKLIMQLATDCEDLNLQIVAITCLVEHSESEEAFELLLTKLNDRSWRIRDVAIAALVDFADHDEDRVVLALINRLAVEEGKLRKNLVEALQKITGADPGSDSDAWSDWYRDKKRAEQGLPPKKGDGRGSRVKRIFETETYSNRYVFLIDSSVSMTEKISEEEKERLRKSFTKGPGDEEDPRRELDWSKINCKLDLAREELIRSLEVMDPETTQFTIIAFSDAVEVWQDELVPCDEKNRKNAESWLRSLKGKNKTNVFGALDAAFDLSEKLAGMKAKEKKTKKGDKVITGPHPDEALPDTIFIYTDGYATDGKYCGSGEDQKEMGADKYAHVYAGIMDKMVEEVADRNRVARITLNTVGVGRQDSHTLRKLADKNGGRYVAIGQTR